MSRGITSLRVVPTGRSWHEVREEIVDKSVRSNSKNAISARANAVFAFRGMESHTRVYGTWMVPNKYDGTWAPRISQRNECLSA